MLSSCVWGLALNTVFAVCGQGLCLSGGVPTARIHNLWHIVGQTLFVGEVTHGLIK